MTILNCNILLLKDGFFHDASVVDADCLVSFAVERIVVEALVSEDDIFCFLEEVKMSLILTEHGILWGEGTRRPEEPEIPEQTVGLERVYRLDAGFAAIQALWNSDTQLWLVILDDRNDVGQAHIRMTHGQLLDIVGEMEEVHEMLLAANTDPLLEDE